MKKLILLLCFGIISTIAGYSPANNTLTIESKPPYRPFKQLMEAVAIVESSNNPLAYNTSEEATGLLQIRPVRLKDFNNKTGHNYKLDDMYNPEISKSIFYYYASRIGHNNPEKIIRCWNGGERGMEKQATKLYYQKVLLSL